MVVFKYLANILWHSSLNSYFHEFWKQNSECILTDLAGFYCGYGE